MTSNTVELTHELGQNFIDYAMAVNTDRSIPDARTGLKPVHKRILYCALDEGNTSNKKYVKCASNVGSVIAKWHPHGDSSAYGALVRLAQPWIMRYPLIDFHGNVGSQSGAGPAPYRYTECRLAKIAEDGLLDGIKKKCVDFGPNFDDTKEEPKTLPSIFPNLLCNPNSGIGVAMACSWAPHNLVEVAAAINDYLDGKEPMLPGPDFPTGGLILNKDDVPKIMATGRGSVKIRSRYKFEKSNIVFIEIPYGETTEDIIKQLQALGEEEKLDGVAEIRNESNKSGIRLVLECKKNADLDTIITTVYQSTNLQSSFYYNQVALVDGEPKLLNLKDCIEIYIKHNVSCIVREYTFDLNKVKARLEVVDGLLIALEDIDNVIHLIKTSDNPKQDLMDKYKLTENQTKAILDMRLAKLSKIEKIQLEQEHKELVDKQAELESVLASEDKQIQIVRNRLKNIVDKYGDERRTELAQVEITKAKKEKPVVEPKDCVVIVNKNNTIKRVDKKNFKVQKRNTAGVKTNGDIITHSISTNTQDMLMVFSSYGKMYRLLVDNIPEGTNTSTGTPIGNLITFEENEVPMAYTTLERDTDKQFIFFATKNGVVKKSALEDYDKMKRTGIIALTLKEGDELADVTFINQEEMMLVTENGMAIRFPTEQMSISSRTAQGVKGMNVGENDHVIRALPIPTSAVYLALASQDNLCKKVELKEFNTQNRGGKGVICSKTKLAGATVISEDSNILVSGDKTSIVIPGTDIPLVGRTAAGNTIIKNNMEIVSLTCM